MMGMHIWLYSLASVFLVSVISLVGVASLYMSAERLTKVLLLFVSFAVGALFGDAFIHLLPEAYELAQSKLLVSILVIVGILLFFILEKFIYWRHCHIYPAGECPRPVAFMNLVGDGLHNMIDGLIIGASFTVSIQIGLATTIAVILHEIPQEVGDFGILLHGGLSRKKALVLNFLCATLAIAGCLFALVIGPRIRDFTHYILPLTAGGFIYIAGADLIPELNKEVNLAKSIKELSAIALGVLIMAALAFVK